MRLITCFIAVLLGITTAITACKNDGDADRAAAVKILKKQQPASDTAAAAAPPTHQNLHKMRRVWHCTCADGSADGAGSAIACAKCGKTLAHNQTYHQ